MTNIEQTNGANLAPINTDTALLAMASFDQLKTQLDRIQEFQQKLMTKGQDYDDIPGTNRPTLLKPGAERLLMAFNLTAIEADREVVYLGNGHREYIIKTRVVSRIDGRCLGEASGSCSTMEAKYRYRNARRVCPSCGAEALKISKFGAGGFYCFDKIGGCNAKFAINDQRVTGQVLGRIENEDIADSYNTALKMAQKRSLVAAALISCAASHLFTQDMEEHKTAARVDADTGEVYDEDSGGAGAAEAVNSNARQAAQATGAGGLVCTGEGCTAALTTGQRDYSQGRFERPLCPTCQKKQGDRLANTPDLNAGDKAAAPAEAAPKGRGFINSAIYKLLVDKGIPEGRADLRHTCYTAFLKATYNINKEVKAIGELDNAQAQALLMQLQSGGLDNGIKTLLAASKGEALPQDQRPAGGGGIADPAHYSDNNDTEPADPFGDG